MEAARVIGINRWHIMYRHVLPNTLTPVLVISTIQVAEAVMSEAALSFLGLGMPVTKPSLGISHPLRFRIYFQRIVVDHLLSGQSADHFNTGDPHAGGLAEEMC